jgi:polyisoprenoid-binding protein YceI
MRFLFTMTCCLLLSSPVMAASNWTIDAAQVQFKGKDGGKDFTGEFKKLTPVISFDVADLKNSSIEVTVDTSSILTGNSTYDGVLPTPEWFNVTKFPNAVFKSKSIKSIDDTHFEADGTLTILGISKDIILSFKLTTQNGKAHANGDVTIKRLDFGLGQSVDAKGDTVSNDVTVHFDVSAHH